MKAIVNGKIILPDRIVTSKALLFDEQIIGLADAGDIGEAAVTDASGMYVAPGLIDMHCHGYLGMDTCDGSPESIVVMAEGLIKNGVTGWLPTTMTLPLDYLRTILSMMRSLRAQSRDRALWRGTQILGVNFECVFLNPARKGAHQEELIRPLSADFVKEHADIIKVFTVAPEMPGNLAAIEEIARETDVLVSIGHSDATYEQALEAISKGVRHATHLFNAMSPLNHRNPGVVGAMLTSPDVSVELIADTFHIHPGLFPVIAKLKGRKLALVTDSMNAAGLADGEYDLGGQTVSVRGIQCRLADGTIAGSVLTLNQAVRNMMKHTDEPVNEIVNMASLNPATSLGVQGAKGSLEAGKDADIIIADDQFAVEKTFIKGELLYTKPANKESS